MHFTPTSASWLNMVERFFRDINTERLRRGVFAGVPELETAIKKYAALRNTNPNPCIWAKSARDMPWQGMRIAATSWKSMHMTFASMDSMARLRALLRRVHRSPGSDASRFLLRLITTLMVLASPDVMSQEPSRRQPVPATSIGSSASSSGTRAALSAMAPVLTGFDGYHFPTVSSDHRVRRYFDQGVLLVYGFNPEEATRSFEAALAIDPACAACWWALAWALGPNINTDMGAQSAVRVEQAIGEARRHARRASPVQRSLINALALRHPGNGRIDEAAYAQSMRTLARRHPHHADVAFLAAEALLNLHPYDWWAPDGAPLPWTREIEGLLARAMALNPRHPGAHHYWIHLQESSPHPQRALPSAEFLADAVPGSGHLLHMPSHIDMRVGRFDDAIRANQRSIEADQRYLAQVDVQGAYRVGYVAHNHHFLWAAAAMAGRQQLALRAAQAAWPAACGPAQRDLGTAIVQQYAVLPYFTLVRFGQWDALLHGTLPPDTADPYPLAIWHYARGTALTRTGQLDAAKRELQHLERFAADPSLAAFKVKNLNPTALLARIAVLTLRAELALARGAAAAGVALLREATRIEDALAYDEPHLWLAPTRHALGAALLAAGQADQAEQVYRQDLAHYPNNGWSLTGLALALAQQGQAVRAQQVEEQAQVAFRGAERVPGGSRF
jgi:tetratricopeptide (TPR) repeat protein